PTLFVSEKWSMRKLIDVPDCDRIALLELDRIVLSFMTISIVPLALLRSIAVALYLNFTLSRTTPALPPAEGITCSPPPPDGAVPLFSMMLLMIESWESGVEG